MINKNNLNQLIKIARKCSDCAMLHFNKLEQGTINYKKDFSPVTEGDIAVNQIAVSEIQKIFPKLIIVSEEFEKSQEQFNNNNIFWLIDPIDGTKEFINGSPNFTVNFALIKDQTPFFGLIAQPYTGTIWFNFNKKAWKLEKNQNLDHAKNIHCFDVNLKKLTIIASLNHRNKDLDNWIDLVKPANQKSFGSSIKFCVLAEGKADLYPRNTPTMEWDIAAGHSILKAAGGNIVSESGMQIQYGKANFRNKNFLAYGKINSRLPSYFLTGLNEFDKNKYKQDINFAVTAIKNNKLVVFPTETVYGLGAIGNNKTAIKSIYAAKNRPSNNPLIAHTFNKQEAEKIVDFTQTAHLLANQFWPGPLTIILQVKKTALSYLLSQGSSTLAVRVPSHPIALDILEKVKIPILAPSANKSGGVSPTSAIHAKNDFGPNYQGKDWELAQILDYGDCEVGIESTVVDCRGENPIILRHGIITKNMISNATKTKVLTLNKTVKLISPGLLQSHYSPNAEVLLNQKKIIPNSGWLAFGKLPKMLQNHGNLFNLSFNGNLIQAGELLYSGLRFLDAIGIQKIQVMPIPKTGIGIAINDRLKRASYKDSKNF
ncbi:MAG: L-threonylcarbamoyladenylate synthase [Proteobacteria bacterium]|nr:L-threonylcarbamoyladenylate synthase [Pseudomonadota bacterium]MDA1136182.1 L-threonylcarbamoyladenylate synthase [Pseudomonadota bacterium]